MHVIESVRNYWKSNTLYSILFIALAIRLISTFFSHGYPFHDEHWDVIRVAQDWVNGIPHWISDDVPPNHSMFYAGINAAILYVLEGFNIYDPNSKMTVIRLLHAIYSLLIVYFGYKLTERLYSKSAAVIVGLIFSVIWFLPLLSVQNLVEIVCIPPVLGAFYVISYEKSKSGDWLMAGALLGLAFTFRLHVVIFAGGIGMVMLFKQQFKQAVLFSLGFLIVSFLITGVIDIIFWDYPFQSIVAYFAFNTDHAYAFTTGPVYRFVLTVLGMVVPPISAFLLIGYAKSWKVSKYMWLAGTLFFIVHSIFPNKQERFIIPFLPIFIILGVIGWLQIVKHFELNHKKWHKISWTFFWGINIVVGVALSLSYLKKDRIEPLVYISQYDDVSGVIIESNAGVKPVPEFYLGGLSIVNSELERYTQVKSIDAKQIRVVYVKSGDKATTSLAYEIQETGTVPSYIIFKGNDRIEERKSELMTIFPGFELQELTVIQPSLLDRLLHFFNPRIHKENVSIVCRLSKANTTYLNRK